jgi:hypothetical protein
MLIPTNENKFTYPFISNGQPFSNNQPWIGGTIRIITDVSANTDLTISHQLKAVPKGMLIVNANGVFTPEWYNWKPQDNSNIYIQLDTAITGSNSISLFIF